MPLSSTPTPWHFYDFMGDGIGYLRGPDDNEIAHHGDTCNSPEVNKANAALIVKSVNAFEPMREALRHMINMLEASLFAQRNGQGVRWECGKTDVAITPDGKYMLSQARAALKLAGDAT